ncbi:homoserine kinase [Nakamurella leprariae]|uniref:Homoserine kinase n=1 Tax=Nakamurella leprariae TaxID=2803911 RepID=A0A938Y873_9ACTN|nr:homoserine kinase [Nakamurella leprariae]MBM9465752.1 homoserine kinase [Nakamurella leprariae]
MTEPQVHAGGSETWWHVRVPATSANLGPGFDSFGLALDLHDEMAVRPTAGGFVVEIDGPGRDAVPLDESHLVLRAMSRAFATVGQTLPGVHLRCWNRIPHGGGLGSSAAAIVAGLLLGRALLPTPDPAQPDRTLSDADLFDLACELEGHPDNVAPALFGGLTLCHPAPNGGTRVVSPVVHPDLRPIAFEAAASSSTKQSRGLLPATVPHADAAANAAAAGLLVLGLTQDPSVLLPATADRLHQPYRAASMPASTTLIADLRAAGLPAVVSGAGPSVLVLCDQSQQQEVHRLLDAGQLPADGFTVRDVAICRTGGQVRADDGRPGGVWAECAG